MKLQTVLLRFMLGSLAVTAVLGVLIVLLQWDELILRALGTALATAAASGLMVPGIKLLEEPKHHRAGMSGIGVIVLTYVLIVPLIWWQPEYPSWEAEIYEALWEMLAWIVLTGILATVCLSMRAVSDDPWPTRAGLVFCLLMFTELTIGTWSGVSGDRQPGQLGDERWLMAGLATAVFGSMAVASLVKLAARYWPGLGLLSAGVAWVLATREAFQETDSKLLETWLTIAASVAATVTFANLLMLAPLRGWELWVRATAIASGLLGAAGIDILIIHEIWSGQPAGQEAGWLEAARRAAGAAAIIGGCATVGLLILVAMARHAGKHQANGPYLELSLTCPRCGTRQTLPTGKSQCPNCLLNLSIQISERE